MDSLSKFNILTITHKDISLKRISEFMVSDDEDLGLKTRLQTIKSHFGFSELYYLATCNRVLYFFVGDQSITKEFIRKMWLFP